MTKPQPATHLAAVVELQPCLRQLHAIVVHVVDRQQQAGGRAVEGRQRL